MTAAFVAPSTPSDAMDWPQQGFHALAPSRVADSRFNVGFTGAFAAGATKVLTVTGAGGVPTTGVSAVVVNLTAVDGTAGLIQAWPHGRPRPTTPPTSNVNYGSQPVGNLAVLEVDGNGQVDFYNDSMFTVDLIVDVQGWYDTGGVAEGAGYTPVAPTRIVDTRTPPTAFAAHEIRELQLTGVGGVPASGVSAVVVNLTAANGRAGLIQAWTTGAPRPTAPPTSNVNYGDQPVGNLAMLQVNQATGRVSFYNDSDTPVDLIVDLQGWYDTGGASIGAGYRPVTPARVADSRSALGFAARFESKATRELLLTGVGGVPSRGVAAVVVNLTATNGAAGLIQAWPFNQARPEDPPTSNVNYANQPVGNLAVLPVDPATGKVSFYNDSSYPVDLIVDVQGWFGVASTVTLVGASGTFGSYLPAWSTTPSGSTFKTTTVNNWSFDPGQTGWFSTVANDGTVAIANGPQKSNVNKPTATNMVLSTFSPSLGANGYGSVRIKTTKGNIVAVNPSGVGGADIQDVQALPNGEIAYISQRPYSGWNDAKDLYPTFGTIKKDVATGQWVESIRKEGLEIQKSTTNVAAGTQACPSRTLVSLTQVTATASFCRGPVEMALLASGDLAITQYDTPTLKGTSGQLMVLGQDGTLKATLAIPPIPDPYSSGCANPYLSVHPREIQADTNSSSDGDHFAVVYDTWKCTGTAAPFVVQEFTFNPNAGAANATTAITPISAPILPNSGAMTERLRYDQHGNLWLATEKTTNAYVAAGLYIFPRTSTLAQTCPFVSWTAGWGAVCASAIGPGNTPELTSAPVLGLRSSKPIDLVEDATKNLMVLTTISGRVQPIVTTTSAAGMTFTDLPVIDLGLHYTQNEHSLQTDKPPSPHATYPTQLHPSPSGMVDAKRHILWIPVRTTWNVPDVDFVAPNPPLALPQYLYRIDLNSL